MLARLMKRPSGAAVLCLGLAFGSGAWAFMDYQTFEKYACNAEMAPVAMQSIPIANPLRRAQFTSVMAEVLDNKKLCARWYKEVSASLIDVKDPNAKQLMLLLSSQYFASLISSGYLRLTAEDRKFLFEHDLLLSSYMDDKTCAIYLFGYEVILPSDTNPAVGMFIDEMSDQRFARLMDVMRRAVRAEADDFPYIRILNANEVAIAQKTFENALVRYIQSAGGQEGARFYGVLTNPQGYSYAEQCKVGQTYAKIIIDLEGTPGDLVRLMLLSQQ